MIDELTICPFCGRSLNAGTYYTNFAQDFQCANCGIFRLNMEARLYMEDSLNRHQDTLYQASGYIREASERGSIVEIVKWEDFFGAIRPPKTVMDKINILLLYFTKKTTFLYEEIGFKIEGPAIAYARDERELYTLTQALYDLKFIKYFTEVIANYLCILPPCRPLLCLHAGTRAA